MAITKTAGDYTKWPLLLKLGALLLKQTKKINPKCMKVKYNYFSRITMTITVIQLDYKSNRV